MLACSVPEASEPQKTTETVTVESTNEAADKQTLTIGEQTFLIEIADTPAAREQGLMNREFMETNHGMLFVFEGVLPRTFWMKNTLIPLDMIWLDEAMTIVDIQAAEPCKVENCPTYTGQAPAMYVLELNQGVLQAQVGDRVEF